MGKPIIEVANLSKKYTISHQRSYLALRDSIASGLSKPFAFLRQKKGKSLENEVFWALKEVSFQVKEGEVLGVIGRNGAGKTTLLKILSRITFPTAGKVRLRGRIGSLLEVGTGFHPELTGRENIYFNGAILGMKNREIGKKFDEIVDFSGVEKFLDTPIKRYSSGMQVRLAFSVAAHLEPEILLVDEVLAVGDVQFQKKCLGKMENVSRCGRTILFVSHNMNAIRTLCGRTIMLEAGRISLDSDTEAVVARYLDQNLSQGVVLKGKELSSRVEGSFDRLNPLIRLEEVGVYNDQGVPSKIFNSDQAITIGITYRCRASISDLRLIIYIVDEENKQILTTVNIDSVPEADFSRKKPGVYRSVCCIPPNLFGEKRLFVSVHLEYPKIEHFVLDRVLGFDVVFHGYNTISAIFKQSFFRPQLAWQSEYIGEAAKGD